MSPKTTTINWLFLVSISSLCTNTMVVKQIKNDIDRKKYIYIFF